MKTAVQMLVEIGPLALYMAPFLVLETLDWQSWIPINRQRDKYALCNVSRLEIVACSFLPCYVGYEQTNIDAAMSHMKCFKSIVDC